MKTRISSLSLAIGLVHLVAAQEETTVLRPQANDFGSSYTLSPEQRSAAGISATLANNVEVALNFERSNWAEGSVSDIPFYRVPSNSSTASAGSLLKLEANVNASDFTLPPGTAISRIMYQTETLNGSLVPASAYVLWPYLPRQMPDGYPIVSWTHGTTGMFAECGPTHVRNLWYHFEVPYALVQQGYVVVAPDYQGLGIGKDAKGNPILHPYLVNPSQANDVFYSVQAAQTAFGELSKRFVNVGHSQGGGVAWGVAERQAKTPVDGYLGTVAGAPVTNVVALVNARPAVSYLVALAARGLQTVYADFDLGSVLTEEGIKRFNLAADIQGCNPVLTELLNEGTSYQPNWQHSQRVEAFSTLAGVGGKEFAGPLLVLQGVADPVVPAAVTDAAVDITCDSVGDQGLEYQRYDGVSHVPVMYAAQRNWLQWVEDRFDGKVIPKGCVRKEYKGALPIARYQPELNWFIEYAQEIYETQ